jgi:hypothetical protein
MIAGAVPIISVLPAPCAARAATIGSSAGPVSVSREAFMTQAALAASTPNPAATVGRTAETGIIARKTVKVPARRPRSAPPVPAGALLHPPTARSRGSWPERDPSPALDDVMRGCRWGR